MGRKEGYCKPGPGAKKRRMTSYIPGEDNMADSSPPHTADMYVASSFKLSKHTLKVEYQTQKYVV